MTTDIRSLTATFEGEEFTFKFDEHFHDTKFEYWRVTDITDPEEPEHLGYIKARLTASDASLCEDAYELWKYSSRVTIGRGY